MNVDPVTFQLSTRPGVRVAVWVYDTPAKLTAVDAIVGMPSLNTFEEPTAQMTFVGPVSTICASFASPLLALRDHVITVVPPLCVTAMLDVPLVLCGTMPANDSACSAYCATAAPLPGLQITALLCDVGDPTMLPVAENPTPNLVRAARIRISTPRRFREGTRATDTARQPLTTPVGSAQPAECTWIQRHPTTA